MVQSKETALFKPGAIAEGINDASETATSYISEIDQNGIKVHASNNVNSNYAKIDANGMEIYKGAHKVSAFGDSISMYDENQHEIFSVDVRSGNITHILKYGYATTNGYGGDINLGRSIDNFNSISVTYYENGFTIQDADTITFNSLPVELSPSENPYGEFGFYVEQINNSTLSINFFSDGEGFQSLIVDNITINYSTSQITSEMDLGAYPDKTLAAPLRIGNGNSANNMSNAFAIDWAGNGLFAGNDIRYGCNPDSSGGKSLIHGEMYNGYYLSSSSGMYMFDVYQMGKLVTLLCMCNKTGSTPAGNNIFTGIVNGSYGSIPAPALDYATGAGFYNTCMIGGFLYMDGDDLRMTIRNLGNTALAANAVVYVSLTYMTNE